MRILTPDHDLQAGDLAVVLDDGNAGGHGGDSSMNMDGVRAVHANASEENSVTFTANKPGT